MNILLVLMFSCANQGAREQESLEGPAEALSLPWLLSQALHARQLHCDKGHTPRSQPALANNGCHLKHV